MLEFLYKEYREMKRGRERATLSLVLCIATCYMDVSPVLTMIWIALSVDSVILILILFL